MSSGFKVVLAVLLAGALFFYYRLHQSQQAIDHQMSDHQNLTDLKSTGQVETKSFEDWQKKNAQSGARFKAWRDAELKRRAQEKSGAQPDLTPTQDVKE